MSINMAYDHDSIIAEIRATDTITESATIIRNTQSDIRLEANPELLLLNIGSVDNMNDATMIADVFMQRFGPIAICRSVSKEVSYPITLLDYIFGLLTMNVGELTFNVHISLVYLLSAFVKRGFKYVRECNNNDLYDDYCFDAAYAREARCDIHIWTYDYATIMKHYAPLNEAVIAYFHHPSRLDKWIETNPDKNYDDFMN